MPYNFGLYLITIHLLFENIVLLWIDFLLIMEKELIMQF